MKILLGILLITFMAWSEPVETKFAEILLKIDKIYQKKAEDYKRAYPNSRLVYRYVALNLFPYLCVTDSTVLNNMKKPDLYFKDYMASVKYWKTRESEHVYVAVVSYGYSKINRPAIKTYRLFGFTRNLIFKDWSEDMNLTVIMTLQDQVEGIYGCKD